MKEVLKDLTDEQIVFICKECGLTKDELFSLDENQLCDQVYDAMCDIEIEEVPLDGEDESDRCILASDLVTILGNTPAIEED